jgi:hypothetical protein
MPSENRCKNERRDFDDDPEVVSAFFMIRWFEVNNAGKLVVANVQKSGSPAAENRYRKPAVNRGSGNGSARVNIDS